MKTSIRKPAAIIFGILLTAFLSQAAFAEGNVNWDKFSKNLVKGLKSENAGIQMSSMQLVIEHGENVKVDDALFEVWSVFRSHKNDKVRQLALTTLTKMNSNLAMEYIKRQAEFEKCPEIKKQIQHIVTAGN